MVMNPAAIVAGVFLVGLGIYGTRNNVTNLRQLRRLGSASATDITNIRAGSGFVGVEGEARSVAGETVHAPVADTDAVVRLDKLQKIKGVDAPDSTGSKGWSTVERSLATVPFDVDDRTGLARVEVPEPDTQYPLLAPGLTAQTTSFLLDTDNSNRGGRKPTQEEMERLFDAETESDGQYRIKEGVIEPGETVFVAGYAEQISMDADANVVLTGGDSPSDVIVADRQRSEIDTGNIQRTVFELGITVTTILGGFLLVAFGFDLV